MSVTFTSQRWLLFTVMRGEVFVVVCLFVCLFVCLIDGLSFFLSSSMFRGTLSSPAMAYHRRYDEHSCELVLDVPQGTAVIFQKKVSS